MSEIADGFGWILLWVGLQFYLHPWLFLILFAVWLWCGWDWWKAYKDLRDHRRRLYGSGEARASIEKQTKEDE